MRTVHHRLVARIRSATAEQISAWMGSASGITGAMVLAVNLPWSGYGWLAFLLSNLAWITYARLARVVSLFLMQLVFTITSLVGICRWLA